MKSHNRIVIGTGASSILMIFVVLSLTTFGVLSYLTAQSDYKLTAKSITNTKEIYDADAKIEEMLVSIDDYLLQAKQASELYLNTQSFESIPTTMVTDATKNQIDKIDQMQLSAEKKQNQIYLVFASTIITQNPSFSITTDDENNKYIFLIVQVNQTYQIQMQLLLNPIENENRYRIIKNTLVSTKQWESDDLNVWEG